MAVAATVYFLYPEWIAKLWLEHERTKAGLTCQQVDVGAWTIPYLIGGKENTEVVLLVHGFADSKDQFIPLSGQLSRSYHVMALDLPGNGETAIRLNEAYDFESYVDTMVGFLDALSIEKCHLVGYSLGGTLSAITASRHPQRVKSLTLLAPAGLYGDTPSEFDKTMLEKRTHPMILDDRDGLERGLEMVFNKVPSFPDVAMRAMLKQGRARKELYLEIMSDLHDSSDPEEAAANIASITTPTLIVWGELDRICHVSASERWKELNGSFRVEILPEVGHGIVLQRQTEILELVWSHIKKTDIAVSDEP